MLKDLGSTRGTYLNGEKLSEPMVLKNGCTVQIGELQLLYKSQAVQIQDGDEDQSTVFASIDMTTPSDRLYPVIKPEEKLRALQQISQAFGSTLVLGELLDKVLGSLFEIFPGPSADSSCSRIASAGCSPRRRSGPGAGRSATCRSASRSSSGC